MYFVLILVTTVLAPLVSGFITGSTTNWDGGALFVFGSSWVFWGVGIRLLAAGVSQIARPGFTLENILKLNAPGAEQVVQELGFANAAIGVTAIVGSYVPEWLPAAGLVGGLFLVMAAIRHTPKKDKNAKEWIALATDYLVGVIALVFAIGSLIGIA